MSRLTEADLDSVRISGFHTGGFLKKNQAISERVMGGNLKSVAGEAAKNSALLTKLKWVGIAASVVILGANANMRMYIPAFLGASAALWGLDLRKKTVATKQLKDVGEDTAKFNTRIKEYEANEDKKITAPHRYDATITQTGMVGAAEKLGNTLEGISQKKYVNNTIMNTAIAAVGIGIAATVGAPAAALVGGIWMAGAFFRQRNAVQEKSNRNNLLDVFFDNIDIMKAGPAARPGTRTGPTP